MNFPPGIKKWLAFGTGVGLAVEGPRGAESLRVAAVRVRPTGVRVLGGFSIENFEQHPAAEWGAAYAAFAAKLGLKQAAATVVLPRQDVILRHLQMPGVSDKDLDGAVEFQLDSLHPYDDGGVVASWARLPASDVVVVAIARRELVARYAALFAQADIRLAGFTCSGPAIYSALRLFGAAPPASLLALEPAPSGGLEVYGESPVRPLFSATFDVPQERAVALASAELRFEQPVAPLALSDLLKSESPHVHAAALASACPHLSLAVNLLPADQRQTVSKLRWVPSAVLGAAVLLLAGGLLALPGYQESRYLQQLDAEIAQVQPTAQHAAELDRQAADAQNRIQALDDLRRRPRADMDALAALTGVLTPPAWLNSLQLDGQTAQLTGQTREAAPLLRVIDDSPLFEGSEFSSPPAQVETGQSFRIRTRRSTLRPVERPQAAASSDEPSLEQSAGQPAAQPTGQLTGQPTEQAAEAAAGQPPKGKAKGQAKGQAGVQPALQPDTPPAPPSGKQRAPQPGTPPAAPQPGTPPAAPQPGAPPAAPQPRPPGVQK